MSPTLDTLENMPKLRKWYNPFRYILGEIIRPKIIVVTTSIKLK